MGDSGWWCTQVGFSALPAALLAASHLQLGQFREAEAACEVNGEGASYVRRAKWTHWMKVQVCCTGRTQPPPTTHCVTVPQACSDVQAREGGSEHGCGLCRGCDGRLLCCSCPEESTEGHHAGKDALACVPFVWFNFSLQDRQSRSITV